MAHRASRGISQRAMRPLPPLAAFRSPPPVMSTGVETSLSLCLRQKTATGLAPGSLRTLCLLAGAIGWLMHRGRRQSRRDPRRDRLAAGSGPSAVQDDRPHTRALRESGSRLSVIPHDGPGSMPLRHAWCSPESRNLSAQRCITIFRMAASSPLEGED